MQSPCIDLLLGEVTLEAERDAPFRTLYEPVIFFCAGMIDLERLCTNTKYRSQSIPRIGGGEPRNSTKLQLLNRMHATIKVNLVAQYLPIFLRR